MNNNIGPQKKGGPCETVALKIDLQALMKIELHVDGEFFLDNGLVKCGSING